MKQAPDFAAWRDEVITLPLEQNADVPRTLLSELTLEKAEEHRHNVRRYDEMLVRPGLAPHFCTEFQRQRNIALAALGRKPDTKEVASFSTAPESSRFLDLDTAYYLDYIIRRNEYMNPRGVMQTTRQAMLKLDEVYVSLKAERQAERTWTKDRFGRHERDADAELFEDWELQTDQPVSQSLVRGLRTLPHPQSHRGRYSGAGAGGSRRHRVRHAGQCGCAAIGNESPPANHPVPHQAQWRTHAPPSCRTLRDRHADPAARLAVAARHSGGADRGGRRGAAPAGAARPVAARREADRYGEQAGRAAASR